MIIDGRISVAMSFKILSAIYNEYGIPNFIQIGLPKTSLF